MRTLPDQFYLTPEWASTTMSKKDLKELLLTTDDFVMARGIGWNIKSKHIGAGVYKVTLREAQ